MCTDPTRHWLLLATLNETVEVRVIATRHPEGPRGHVPERLADRVEDSDGWLLEEAFGLSPSSAPVNLEIREMAPDWMPANWT